MNLYNERFRQMQYRTNKDELFQALATWNRYLKKKIHLSACGGTALTLIYLKESKRGVI